MVFGNGLLSKENYELFQHDFGQLETRMLVLRSPWSHRMAFHIGFFRRRKELREIYVQCHYKVSARTTSASFCKWSHRMAYYNGSYLGSLKSEDHYVYFQQHCLLLISNIVFANSSCSHSVVFDNDLALTHTTKPARHSSVFQNHSGIGLLRMEKATMSTKIASTTPPEVSAFYKTIPLNLTFNICELLLNVTYRRP